MKGTTTMVLFLLGQTLFLFFKARPPNKRRTMSPLLMKQALKTGMPRMRLPIVTLHLLTRSPRMKTLLKMRPSLILLKIIMGLLVCKEDGIAVCVPFSIPMIVISLVLYAKQ
jgi:hypothetical protein